MGFVLHDDLTGLDCTLLKSADGQSYVLSFAGTDLKKSFPEVVLNAGMEAAAQVMATEQYTCWDDIGKSWYSSSMSCDLYV